MEMPSIEYDLVRIELLFMVIVATLEMLLLSVTIHLGREEMRHK